MIACLSTDHQIAVIETRISISEIAKRHYGHFRFIVVIS